MRVSFSLFAIVSVAVLLVACDQDPLGLGCRRIAGNYCLRQWEDGETYYIDALNGKDSGGGGVINGSVQAIAWSPKYIVALRQPTVLSDGYGYMSINVQNGQLQGPVPSISAFGDRSIANLTTVSPKTAWDKLGR